MDCPQTGEPIYSCYCNDCQGLDEFGLLKREMDITGGANTKNPQRESQSSLLAIVSDPSLAEFFSCVSCSTDLKKQKKFISTKIGALRLGLCVKCSEELGHKLLNPEELF